VLGLACSVTVHLPLIPEMQEYNWLAVSACKIFFGLSELVKFVKWNRESGKVYLLYVMDRNEES
jgi:hypothetical protein